MKHLASALQITSPSATSLVNRLTSRRWVHRGRDTKNRRVVRLRLTSEGTKVLRAMHAQRTSMMRGILRLLSAKEQRQLASILEKLRDSTTVTPHSSFPERV